MTSTRTAAPGAAYQRSGVATGPIVVAITGEDASRAIEAAQLLAPRADGAVRVVSVVEPPPPAMVGLEGVPVWWPDSGEYVAQRRARVTRQLRDILGEQAAWPVDVLVDAPAHAIADVARAHRASLVVMGIGRHDVAARLFGGETTLRTIRRAQVPVLAVTDVPVRLPAPVAVAAMDFSPSSVKAAQTALDLVASGGTLHLVHVWSRHPIDYPDLRAADEAYERALPERFAKVERALLDRARDVTILPTSLLGNPAEQLVAFARAHGADVIAAGRRGHGLLERLLVGRVTTGLVRGAPCAVLVTPEPPPVEREALERALTGTSASQKPEEWQAMLEEFSRRNAGRRTRLEIDDPELGAQAEEAGYTLTGATYDRRDGRVALMLGAPGGAAHLTRLIDGATGIAMHSDRDGRDLALAVTRGAGQTLLTFLPDAA